MTDEHSPAIPIDVHPEPVVAYTVRGGQPLVTATNECFETVFDSISSETPVAELFTQCNIANSIDSDKPTTHLHRGESTSFSLDGAGEHGPFYVQVIPTDDDTGYLVVSTLDDGSDLAETAGVGQVASVISHDLRNPLDVAKAHLRAARETGEPEHFDAIDSAHDRMEQIIRDVLTLTRGRSVVTPSEQVDIESAVADAWQSVETERATLDIAEGLPTTTADPDRIRRLFENLFRNSIEHGADDRQSAESPGDGDTPSEITIRVGALENGFYISDDGSGVPLDEQETVFRPGYSTKDRGTGLGLAIVEKIVSGHDWNLSLTTAQDGGARFEVRF